MALGRLYFANAIPEIGYLSDEMPITATGYIPITVTWGRLAAFYENGVNPRKLNYSWSCPTIQWSNLRRKQKMSSLRN